MGFLEAARVFPRFLTQATNSSHFIWFLAKLEFFETPSDRWVFAFLKVGSVVLVPLEPLTAEGFRDWNAEAFLRNWGEFKNALSSSSQIFLFVAVTDPFREMLADSGFQTVQVGQEPWVDLKDCIPHGNSTKGVRAAKNQALRAGVSVEEWGSSSLSDDPTRKERISELFQFWKNKRWLLLEHFLNATDPLAHLEVRRIFVAKSSQGRLEGFLIATPIAGIKSYFLEDLILRPDAARGCGELLTLEALVRLRDLGGIEASLGVVSMTSVTAPASSHLPSSIQKLLVSFPRFLRKLYNFDGLEVFRKRFKPHRWGGVHLAFQNTGELTDARAWLLALFALARAFRPRFNFSVGFFKGKLSRAWAHHRVSWVFALLSLFSFGAVNRWGELPEWALVYFGFSGSAPLHEWFYRTLSSDFLYFDPYHFWIWATLYWLLLRKVENTQKIGFVAILFILVSYLDDFLNYSLVMMPFSFLHPKLFHKLTEFKDVGSSLGFMTFVGFHVAQFKKNKEILFSIVLLGTVFGFVFNSFQHYLLIINLNHFLFLIVGFVIGTVKLELQRRRSREASKGKSPKGLLTSSSKSILHKKLGR